MLSQFIEIETVFHLGNHLPSFRPIPPLQRAAPAFANSGNCPRQWHGKGCGHKNVPEMKTQKTIWFLRFAELRKTAAAAVGVAGISLLLAPVVVSGLQMMFNPLSIIIRRRR